MTIANDALAPELGQLPMDRRRRRIPVWAWLLVAFMLISFALPIFIPSPKRPMARDIMRSWNICVVNPSKPISNSGPTWICITSPATRFSSRAR